MSISEIKSSLENLETQVGKLTKNSWYWSKKKTCNLASKVIQDVASYTKEAEGALFPKTKEKDAICETVARLERKMESHTNSGVFNRKNKPQSTTAKTIQAAIRTVKECYPWSSTAEIETAITASFGMKGQPLCSSSEASLRQMPPFRPKQSLNWSLRTEFSLKPPSAKQSLVDLDPGSENIPPRPNVQSPEQGPQQIPKRTASCFDITMGSPKKKGLDTQVNQKESSGKPESPDDWSF